MKVWTLAVATSVTTFALLLIGGSVNPTGSSLACPDWPTCYGSFFPEMTGGVLFEHSHRIVATLVGALTVGLAVAIFVARKRDAMLKRIAVVAVLLVIFQGVLGGVTVLMRLPTMVSTSHLAIALLFFGLTIFLCFRLRPGATAGVEKLDAVRRITAWAMAGVYLQILLGAFVRHTGSGRFCLTIPFCDGELWPAAGPAALNMLHRYAGVTVFLLVIAAAVVALRRLKGHDRPTARLAAALVPWIAGLQVALGFVMVARKVEWVSAMAHTGVAALLLGALVVQYVAAGPLSDPVTRTSAGKVGASRRVEGVA